MEKRVQRNIFLKITPFQRTAISLLVALLVAVPLYFRGLDPVLLCIYGWLGFSMAFMLLSWVVIFKRGVDDIKKYAQSDDGSRIYVFVMLLLSAFASMIAVLVISTAKQKLIADHLLNLPATVAAMVMAWLMVQTQYIFHYAHEYYGNEQAEQGSDHNGGLEFPKDDRPDYLDFAYYSFCMGCTFQVSDVDVTSKKLRRITMVHGLLAFFMNTFVVALTINLVAGMSD